jgi:hypothetical protein
VVGVVDEQRLAELALTATASQLARTIAGFRAADGRRIGQQTKRRLSWQERDDGTIEYRARLPKDDSAQLFATVEAAKEQFGPLPAKPDPCTSNRNLVCAATATPTRWWMWPAVSSTAQDRSGEDRTLVVVHVSAENLAEDVTAVHHQTPRTEARP